VAQLAPGALRTARARRARRAWSEAAPRCGPWTCHADPAQDGFAKATLAAIDECLPRGEQSLVSSTGEAIAPVLSCEALRLGGELRPLYGAPRAACPRRRLRCHHCGAEEGVPRACPTCGNVHLKPVGRGTQRVEE